MPVLTIEAPTELLERPESPPRERRDIYTLAALTAGMETLSPEEAARDHAEMTAAVEEALAGAEAGKDRPFEEYVAEIRAREAAVK